MTFRGVLIPMGGDARSERGWRLNRYGQLIYDEGFEAVRRLLPEKWRDELRIVIRCQDPPHGQHLHPRRLETPMGAFTLGSIYINDDLAPWSQVMWDTIDRIDGVHHGAATMRQNRIGRRRWMRYEDLPDWTAKLQTIRKLIAPGGVQILDAPEWWRRSVDDRMGIQANSFMEAFAKASVIPGGNVYGENYRPVRDELIGLSTTIKDNDWDARGWTHGPDQLVDWNQPNQLPVIHSRELIKMLLDGWDRGPQSWVATAQGLIDVLERKVA